MERSEIRGRRSRIAQWALKGAPIAPSALLKIPLENVPVDRRQRDEVLRRHMLVDLVYLPAQQSELDHRAIVLDEARIRCAAGGRECRLQPGDLGDRVADHLDE